MCQRLCTKALFLIKTSWKNKFTTIYLDNKILLIHVMDHNSLIKAVISRHRNTLYHTDASAYHNLLFVRPPCLIKFYRLYIPLVSYTFEFQTKCEVSYRLKMVNVAAMSKSRNFEYFKSIGCHSGNGHSYCRNPCKFLQTSCWFVLMCKHD